MTKLITEIDTKLSDTEELSKKALEECDGSMVPVLWNFERDKVLGHAELKCKDGKLLANIMLSGPFLEFMVNGVAEKVRGKNGVRIIEKFRATSVGIKTNMKMKKKKHK